MDINLSIVDQRLDGIVRDQGSLIANTIAPNAQKATALLNDSARIKSMAFVLLCVSTMLELPFDSAVESLTEGSNDASIDAIYWEDVVDGEFTVNIFQAKYQHKLEGTSAFPESEIKKVINTLRTLFDPKRKVALNQRLLVKIEEIRSLILDGYLPKIQVICCNNGQKWDKQAQLIIDNEQFQADQVEFCYFNHNDIISILRKKQRINTQLQLQGGIITEDFNFKRVLIGKVSVKEIAQIFENHGDLLLERNIRRYLGLNNNRVNSSIHHTLLDQQHRQNFYFLNNGITAICKSFSYNALQKDDYVVRIQDLQIINGGQTCRTIYETLKQIEDRGEYESVCVLFRLYAIDEQNHDFVQKITHATNSQNPVDLRDLHANDQIQQDLEIGIKDLGYNYRRLREDTSSGSASIQSTVLAEAVLAIWRKKPHQAKFLRREHFGKLYNEIFNNLTPAQAILAVLIFRLVENERKRPELLNPVPEFLPYAAHYIAMVIGEELLAQHKLKDLNSITHTNLANLQAALQNQEQFYLEKAVTRIQQALKQLYTRSTISLQQLSATFRRGDLLSILESED